MKYLTLALSVFALTAGCADSLVHPAPAAKSASTFGAETARYVQDESSADVFEIEAGRLAMRRASNEALRRYALAMVNSHSHYLVRLEQLAQNSTAITTAGTMLPQHLALLSQLQSARSNFDDAYRNIEVMTHLQAWDRHQLYAARGRDALLRDFAFNLMPVVREHLSQVQAIALKKQTHSGDHR